MSVNFSCRGYVFQRYSGDEREAPLLLVHLHRKRTELRPGNPGCSDRISRYRGLLRRIYTAHPIRVPGTTSLFQCPTNFASFCFLRGLFRDETIHPSDSPSSRSPSKYGDTVANLIFYSLEKKNEAYAIFSSLYVKSDLL